MTIDKNAKEKGEVILALFSCFVERLKVLGGSADFAKDTQHRQHIAHAHRLVSIDVHGAIGSASKLTKDQQHVADADSAVTVEVLRTWVSSGASIGGVRGWGCRSVGDEGGPFCSTIGDSTKACVGQLGRGPLNVVHTTPPKRVPNA